jgi:hypothetical protein
MPCRLENVRALGRSPPAEEVEAEEVEAEEVQAEEVEAEEVEAYLEVDTQLRWMYIINHTSLYI